MTDTDPTTIDVEATEHPPTSEEAAHAAANWLDDRKGMIVRHEFNGWGNRYAITRLLVGGQPPVQYPDTDLWVVIIHYESLAAEQEPSLHRRHGSTIATPVIEVRAAPQQLRLTTPHFDQYVTVDVPAASVVPAREPEAAA